MSIFHILLALDFFCVAFGTTISISYFSSTLVVDSVSNY